MSARVFILRENEFVRLPSSGTENCFADMEVGGRPSAQTLEHWKEVTIELYQRTDPYHPVRAEVFVRLATNLEMVFRQDYLRRLLDRAREHVWGCPLYVVVDPKSWPDGPQELLPEYGKWLKTALMVCPEWFSTALLAGATDLLDIDTDPSWIMPCTLRDAAVWSRENFKTMLSAGRRAAWRFALVHPKDNTLRRFLRDFEYKREGDGEKSNLIIGVRANDARVQMKWVARALRKYPAPERFVATIHYPADEPLQDLCAKEAIETVRCAGRFQLAYLLHRLNARVIQAPDIPSGQLVEVVRSPSAQFAPGWDDVRPLIVLTCSFDPNSEEYHCLDAAMDVDKVLHKAPGDPVSRVYPSVTTKALINLVAEDANAAGPETRLFAWVHIGHGSKAKGMLQYADDQGTAADRWLACFAAYTGSLPLVFLSTCHSAQVARRFAEAGAGVAIGFGGPVIGEQCQSLVKLVVHAALRSNGNRKTILAEFETGSSHLYADNEEEYYQAQPMAFHPKGRLRLCS